MIEGKNIKKEIPKEPGKRVLSLRKELQLTRIEFENMTGISAETLKQIENGICELKPKKARTLSIIFTRYFRVKKEKASEKFLLYGIND